LCEIDFEPRRTRRKIPKPDAKSQIKFQGTSFQISKGSSGGDAQLEFEMDTEIFLEFGIWHLEFSTVLALPGT
jgi:hypothetical protein